MIPVYIRLGLAINLKTENLISLLDPRIILSFIPGTVLDIFIEAGQAVTKGR